MQASLEGLAAEIRPYSLPFRVLYKPKIDTQKVLFNRKIITQMFLLHQSKT